MAKKIKQETGEVEFRNVGPMPFNPKALEAPSVPADGLPDPPTVSEANDAVDSIAAEIRAAIERTIARLPEGLRGNAFIVEHALNKELDKVDFGTWRTRVFTSVFAMLNTGKSEAPHDPTEVA